MSAFVCARSYEIDQATSVLRTTDARKGEIDEADNMFCEADHAKFIRQASTTAELPEMGELSEATSACTSFAHSSFAHSFFGKMDEAIPQQAPSAGSSFAGMDELIPQQASTARLSRVQKGVSEEEEVAALFQVRQTWKVSPTWSGGLISSREGVLPQEGMESRAVAPFRWRSMREVALCMRSAREQEEREVQDEQPFQRVQYKTWESAPLRTAFIRGNEAEEEGEVNKMIRVLFAD